MKKLTKILSVILCLAMLMGLATVAFAEETTPKQITSLDELVTGTYKLVCVNADGTVVANLGIFDSGWVTNAEYAWTITVNGTDVKLTDSNGTSIAPNGGNNNGIKSGDYNWTVTCTDGLFSFEGKNSDTVKLACNTSSENRFRAYKNGTISSQGTTYITTFAIYESEATVVEGPEEVTIPEAVTIGESTESGKYTTDKYSVTGVVALIEGGTYGNLYIVDDNGNWLYIYGLYNEENTRYDKMTTKPVEGDTITVVGVLGNYKGVAQMKNGTLMTITSGTATAPTEVTIKEATTLAPDAKPFQRYAVRGTIKSISDESKGNMYIQDKEGNQLYVYGLYSKDGLTGYSNLDPKPAVGDEILVVGGLLVYDGMPEIKNARMYDYKEAEEEVVIPDPVEITIAEAIAIGAAQAHNNYTVEKYILTGKIVEITNDKYGNVYIEDEDGNKILIYGLYDEEGNRYDAMDPQPAVGDTITVVGVLGNYKGSAQMQNGVVTAHTPGEPSETGDPILVAVCALLVSGGAVAILPKKREF